jgi:hypothetical protein
VRRARRQRVERLLSSHNVLIAKGRRLGGAQLTTEVRDRIDGSDGLIALETRRERVGEAAGPKAGAPSSVFVSAGVKDAWEEAVRDALARRGLVVLTASDVPGGVPVDAAVGRIVDRLL